MKKFLEIIDIVGREIMDSRGNPTVEATVVGRRDHRSHSGQNHMSHTSYYITFQVESGDRMEFHVSGQEYGLLVEGDRGKVTFQGTRYLGFARTREE